LARSVRLVCGRPGGTLRRRPYNAAVSSAEVTVGTGTVTMLFTDIELSTQLAHSLGTDAWASVLDRHNVIIREALAKHGGVEIRTAGDSFFATFGSATAAVEAAAAMQRNLIAEAWPANATPRVRMGLHTGDARLDTSAHGPDYVGFEVHRGGANCFRRPWWASPCL
jgi:class 3 adenylate cyclase